MQFTSLIFLLIFFPLTLLFYFTAKKPRKNLVLLIASFAFYFWTRPIHFFLLLFVIIFNYMISFFIYKNYKVKSAKNLLFTICMAVNVIILIVFKYLFSTVISFDIFEGITANIYNVLSPLGISVFMLQAISYIIDLRYNRIKLQKNFVDFALYISFFPQIICGPIVRYRDFSNELHEREVNSNTFSRGFSMFLRGLAKKVFVADHMILMYENVYSYDFNKLASATAWLGVIGFGFAIYFHFLAYSDMARGIAKMFGFEIPMNFNYPYVSKSIVEFWRRFNISLTMFCKTYIFTPLWKNNNSLLVNLVKLFGIWIVMSLWYGTAISCLLWGVYIGFIIVMEKLFLGALLEKLPVLIQRVYTIFILTVGWAIFSSVNFETMASLFSALFMQNEAGFVDVTTFELLQNNYIWIILAVVLSLNIWSNLEKRYEQEKPNLWLAIKNTYEVVIFILVIVYCIANSSNMSNFFIYF